MPMFRFLQPLATLPTLLLLAVLPVAVQLATGCSVRPAASDIPQNLRVPDGQDLAFQAHGQGVQIYTWNAAKAAWTGPAPRALLLIDDGVVGFHSEGPTWQCDDGSAIVGAKMAAEVVDPAAIPWLLINVTKASGAGTLAGITFVQRLRTAGGHAPSTPGTVDGEQRLVPYTADYLFYHPR